MTIQQTLKQIKALGLSARYSSEFKEYRVNLKNGTETTAYYTNDAQDAINTASVMLNN